MKLKELFSLIQQIAEDNHISKPYLVGGVPRDKLAGKINSFNDLDITNGDESIKELGFKLASEIPTSKFKTFDDGHSKVIIDNIHVDFSSNYKAPGIRRFLQKVGLKNPTELQEESFSRDFTINTLLLTMDLKTLKDPTGFGILDIENKTIRTCLPARMTLLDNSKRLVRAIYLASKLDFNIDKEIIDFVKNNKNLLRNENNNYSRNKLKKAYEYDKNKTLKYLNEMNLWDYFKIPIELETSRGI